MVTVLMIRRFWRRPSSRPCDRTRPTYESRPKTGGNVMKIFASNQRALGELKGQSWAPRWWAVFLIGLALWAAAVGSVFVTGDLIVLPTVFLLGSFLIPVTAVVWYLDHDSSPALSPRRVVAAFIIAGVLGVLAASVLESWLVFGPGVIGNLKVGLIEELVKGVAIVLVAWGLH